jgi:hypothetical protein
MNNIQREKTEIPCPGGGREIRTTYGEVARRSSLKSTGRWMPVSFANINIPNSLIR